MLEGMLHDLQSSHGVLSVFVAASCVVLGLVIFYIVKSRRERAVLLSVPVPMPAGHWLYGNLHQIPFGRGFKEIVNWTSECGPLFMIRIGPFIHEVMLNGPDEAQALLASSAPKDHFIYRMLIPWIGDGLLVSKGQKWTRNRKLLTPSFHFDILKPYQKLFSKSILTMIRKWERMLDENPKQSIEMFEHVSLMTLDCLMKCIFGLDVCSQTDVTHQNPYVKAVNDLTIMLLKRFRFPLFHSDWIYYCSYSGYKFRQTCKVAQTFSQNVIQRKRHAKKTSGDTERTEKKFVDFIDLLLDCKDEEGNGLEDREIQEEVDTFMFAGHDTTSSAISWCLYNLAANPDCQTKCRQEVNAVICDGEEVQWDDLSRLPYLTMCIKESLRISPPIPVIGRTLTKPLVLPHGKVLPTGTWCVCCIHALHKNPHIYPEPCKFLPERFSPENSAARHSYAFIPFSGGRRNCIGQHFAMNEVKTAAALVLKHFKLSVDKDKPTAEMMKIVLGCTNGLWLYLEKV